MSSANNNAQYGWNTQHHQSIGQGNYGQNFGFNPGCGINPNYGINYGTGVNPNSNIGQYAVYDRFGRLPGPF